ncbi:hypothetical protein [Aliiroseovarius subalbicans]|uniref:hypothetical protein n=1 Tax=Aliiroseovarius subalbicans TaxID=2925840 RepID=UPI001F570747|nr:hypothetical protein [Aliiroseovarius subalbicans]MCI2401020.1 hypothetical protein [Aliiroseovarius subalbicans]
MNKKRLSAQPIREGIAEISGMIKVVWRDYRWNTGRVVRDWHIDPDSAEGLEIKVRSVECKKTSGKAS